MCILTNLKYRYCTDDILEGCFVESTIIGMVGYITPKKRKAVSPKGKEMDDFINKEIGVANVTQQQTVEEFANTSNCLIFFDKKKELLKEL